jgi:hypothetical protein
MTHSMMTEEEVRPLLHTASADVPPGVDLLAAVRRSSRRPRVLVPAVASLGTVAAAAVAVVTAVSVGGAPSAQAQVAAAIDTTAGQSFKVHIVQNSGAVYDGLSDPGRQVGVSTETDGSEWRYIGDTVYAKKKGANLPAGKVWIAEHRPSSAELAEFPAEGLLLKVAPDDPQGALSRLRAKAKISESGSASGSGWTGKHYTFSLAASDDMSVNGLKGGGGAVTGTIDIDSQGRVRTLTFTLAASSPRDAGALHEVMTFSDFGVAVNVTAPPASQVTAEPAAQGKPYKGKPVDPKAGADGKSPSAKPS